MERLAFLPKAVTEVSACMIRRVRTQLEEFDKSMEKAERRRLLEFPCFPHGENCVRTTGIAIVPVGLGQNYTGLNDMVRCRDCEEILPERVLYALQRTADEQLLNRVVSRLPVEKSVFEHEGMSVEVKRVRGYNTGGLADQRGVYEFTEEIVRDPSRITARKHTLVQDTLAGGLPIVRGIVIKNGTCAETLGIDGGRTVRDFMEGFLKCERYLPVGLIQGAGETHE